MEAYQTMRVLSTIFWYKSKILSWSRILWFSIWKEIWGYLSFFGDHFWELPEQSLMLELERLASSSWERTWNSGSKTKGKNCSWFMRMTKEKGCTLNLAGKIGRSMSLQQNRPGRTGKFMSLQPNQNGRKVRSTSLPQNQTERKEKFMNHQRNKLGKPTANPKDLYPAPPAKPKKSKKAWRKKKMSSSTTTSLGMDG